VNLPYTLVAIHKYSLSFLCVSFQININSINIQELEVRRNFRFSYPNQSRGFNIKSSQLALCVLMSFNNVLGTLSTMASTTSKLCVRNTRSMGAQTLPSLQEPLYQYTPLHSLPFPWNCCWMRVLKLTEQIRRTSS
jgi:hypothetical protein